jgi:hypothetical protein
MKDTEFNSDARYGIRKPRFRKLRALLRNADIEHSYLAEIIGRSPGHVSSCLNGKAQWKLDEVYKILDVLGEKPENMHKIFPKDGVDKDFKNQRKGSNVSAVDNTEELPLLPPIYVGKIGERDVYVTIFYK